MKILVQTDDDCKQCAGKGRIEILPGGVVKGAKHTYGWECRDCMCTGKKLEWIDLERILRPTKGE